MEEFALVSRVHAEESEYVLDLLNDLSVPILTTDVPYPRDLFVYKNGNYIKNTGINYSRHRGLILSATKTIAEGGFVVLGKDYAMIANHNINQDDLAEFQAVFPENEPHCIPPSHFEGATGHIDLFTGSVPFADLLSVNKNYYKMHRKYIDAIAKAHNQEIVKTEHSFYWPDNYFVWEDDEPFVILGADSKNLESAFKNVNIDFYKTILPLKGAAMEGANVRCMTNICTIDALESMGIPYDRAA